MNRILALACVVAIGLSACVAAQVEKPVAKATRLNLMPNGRLVSYTVGRLLMAPGVLDELKVTAEQKAQLKKADDEYTRQSVALGQTIQRETSTGNGLPDGANGDAQQRYAEARRSLGKQLEESQLKTLSKQQRQRLQQIQLQADGPLTFLRPEIQEKLNMSPEQAQEISELVGQANQNLAQARNAAIRVRNSLMQTDPKRPNSPFITSADAPTFKAAAAKAVKESESVRRTLDSSIARVLRKKQRDAFQKMCGEPFDLKKITVPQAPVGDGNQSSN